MFSKSIIKQAVILKNIMAEKPLKTGREYVPLPKMNLIMFFNISKPHRPDVYVAPMSNKDKISSLNEILLNRPVA